LIDEDGLRARVKDLLARAPGGIAGDVDRVAKRAGRFRVRRRLLAGVVASGCIAAIVIPLILFNDVGREGRPPAGAQHPGLLIVTQRIDGGIRYTEGSVTHVDVRTPEGALVGSFTGVQLKPEDHLLELTLDPGPYRLSAYQRPCLLGCDFQLGPLVDRCQARFEIPGGSEMTATIDLTPSKGCTFAFHRNPLARVLPPRSPAPIPDVVEVVCDHSGTHVSTEQVQPQPDGVHILEDHQDGAPVFVLAPQDSLRFSLLGSGEDTVENVYPIAPGQSRILCLGGGRKSSDGALYVPLTVVDEQQLWVSPTLDCPAEDQAWRASPFYSTPPIGAEGDPAELVRAYLQGILPNDVVEPAGYPDAAHPAVRVVRDGNVIAIVQLKQNGDGRWVFNDPGEQYAFCRSAVEGFAPSPLG
jgi:hypothetical protein